MSELVVAFLLIALLLQEAYTCAKVARKLCTMHGFTPTGRVTQKFKYRGRTYFVKKTMRFMPGPNSGHLCAEVRRDLNYEEMVSVHDELKPLMKADGIIETVDFPEKQIMRMVSIKWKLLEVQLPNLVEHIDDHLSSLSA